MTDPLYSSTEFINNESVITLISLFLTKQLTRGIIELSMGENMVEKIITDRILIYQLTRKKDNKLIIQYNIKNKRAWFQTDSMLKRKPIEIKRVIDL